MDARRIGEILLERNQITPADLETALRFQAEIGGYIGQALLRTGALSEDNLLSALSDQLKIAIANPAEVPAEAGEFVRAAKLMEIAPKWLLGQCAGVWLTNKERGAHVVHLIADNPLKPELLEVVEEAVDRLACNEKFERLHVVPYIASNSVLEQMSNFLSRDKTAADDAESLDTRRLREMAEEAPVIDFVNKVFAYSLAQNASDIHIEPDEHSFQVRYRIDGILHLRDTQPKSKFAAVASRIKLLSGMNIAEQRLPQDGRQSVRFAGETLDLRVSSLPGTWGESLVLRLLRKEKSLPGLDGLGLVGYPQKVLQRARAQQNGIILVTGPTGSGKSTTLYRMLEEINDGVKKIITIEDPVEYNMKGVTQIQTKSEIGYTFARGLRAILRQDPDVIMVGEIRDGETASIAAQAALTGHLVFSTLHTNSALGAIERLRDLGLEPFLVASALRCTSAQRLARRLCEDCSEELREYPAGESLIADALADGSDIAQYFDEPARWKLARGCSSCNGTGYRGRVALFEAAWIDESLRAVIASDGDQSSVMRHARTAGYLTLFEDGLIKARSGVTSLDEVLRVVGSRVSLKS